MASKAAFPTVCCFRGSSWCEMPCKEAHQDTTSASGRWEMDPQGHQMQNPQRDCLSIPAEQLQLSAPTPPSLYKVKLLQKL